MEKQYAKGIYFNEKHQNAPEWVIGSLSIKPVEFLEWLDTQQANESGYIKLDVKQGKEKPYIELNTWKPSATWRDLQEAFPGNTRLNDN